MWKCCLWSDKHGKFIVKNSKNILNLMTFVNNWIPFIFLNKLEFMNMIQMNNLMKVIWCTYIASCDISIQILDWGPRHVLLYVFKHIINHIIHGTWFP